MIRFKKTALLLLASIVLGGAGARAQDKLLNVSYDPTRELYEELNQAFAEKQKSAAGKPVSVEQSHGGSRGGD